MPEREISLLIEDILEAIVKIRNYTFNMDMADFLEDNKTQDAVIRNFEIIGEAVRRLPGSLKKEYKHIEWDFIVGFRNRIAHEYFGVDYEIVWHILTNDLPRLETQKPIKKYVVYH